jgi:hypothetical protein
MPEENKTTPAKATDQDRQEAIDAKVKAGLSREEATQVVDAQAAHDSKQKKTK